MLNLIFGMINLWANFASNSANTTPSQDLTQFCIKFDEFVDTLCVCRFVENERRLLFHRYCCHCCHSVRWFFFFFSRVSSSLLPLLWSHLMRPFECVCGVSTCKFAFQTFDITQFEEKEKKKTFTLSLHISELEPFVSIKFYLLDSFESLFINMPKCWIHTNDSNKA